MDKCSAVMLSGHKPHVADAVIEATLGMRGTEAFRFQCSGFRIGSLSCHLPPVTLASILERN